MRAPLSHGTRVAARGHAPSTGRNPSPGLLRNPTSPDGRGERTASFAALSLIADRNIHVFDLEFTDRFLHRPGDVRIDLDLEVIHALQRLMVLFAEHHRAFRR